AGRARHVVAVRRALGFFRGVKAAVDELLQQRVIHRDLLELVVAQPIHTRVPDVCDRHAVVVEQTRDERRAHAFALRLRLRGLVDDLVGAVDRVAQGDRLTHVTRAGLDLVAPAVPAGRRDELDDRLDGDAARDLAGVVTANADGQPP